MAKKEKDGFNIFFRKKPSLMLVSLLEEGKGKYGSLLAKQVDCTYSHAVKILQNLQKLSLVTFEKKGRIKIIKLTDRGRDIGEYIKKIIDRLK